MIPQKQIDRRIQEFVEACRAQGIKTTNQRMEILQELARSEQHPDAESLFLGVRKRLPSLSLDTVYRTLRLFEERGIITRVGSIKERARFDANTKRHHRCSCTRCGLISEFYSGTLDRLDPPSEVEAVGTTDTVYIGLRGICNACQAKKACTGLKAVQNS